MARSYAFTFSVTTPNSATLPAGTIISTAAVRPKLFDILLGSSTSPSADNNGRFNISRCSTTGTPGSSPTPAPLDPGDPAATSTLGLAVFTSTAPVIGTTLLQWAQNQRGTWRWVAAPSKELIAPATASNGLMLMNPTVSSAFLMDGSLEYEE